MSQPIPQTITCPKCGKPIEFTLWRSVDTSEPDVVNDIISGEIFLQECGNCGSKTYTDYPILVNDAEHDRLVWYAFPEEKEDVRKVIETGKYAGKLRVVSSQTALREKTAIYHEGLDDRIIEILKAITYERMRPSLNGKQASEIWYVNTHDKPHFEFNIDGEIGCYDLKMSSYDALRVLLEEPLAQELSPEIDQNWAADFLSRCSTDSINPETEETT